MDDATTMMMINVVGVRFRRAGKIYDFGTTDQTVKLGDMVVVETDRGPSLAKVAKLKYTSESNYAPGALKYIVRVATDKDLTVGEKLSHERAMSFTQQKVAELKLDMKVLKAEVQFGGNKVIIYFSAPGRVDFRELVKQLASGLKARVELKQVGARDETKILGGCGICGKEYCCSSWLCDFLPVSIKMAKNQDLALNPSKVSGSCGRLLCCLTYEDCTYSEYRKHLIPKNSKLKLPDGTTGVVTKCDLLKQTVSVNTDDNLTSEFKISDVEILQRAANEDFEDTKYWGANSSSEDLEKLAKEVDDNTTTSVD